MKDIVDILIVSAMIGVAIAAMVCYAKALTEVKMGRLIVYRDWGDFFKASAWIILLPFGLLNALYGETRSSQVFGVVVAVGGVVSFWWACAGAFRYNTGSRRGLALFARFAVTLLCVCAIGKLSEKFDQYKRGELGVIRGVLIPALIFAWVFHEFIQPMIGLQYYHAWRLARE